MQKLSQTETLWIISSQMMRVDLDSMAERIERSVSKAVADSSNFLRVSLAAASHENLGKAFHTYKVDVDRRLSRLEEATLSEARVLELARRGTAWIAWQPWRCCVLLPTETGDR
eukprot:4979935-Amphidinium_carterae.1